MPPIKKPNSCGSEARAALRFRPALLLLLAPLLVGLGGCASGPARNAPPSVDRAPDFLWIASNGKAASSRAFRGQPMVILVAAEAGQGDVRAQARRLEAVYRDFAGLQTIFIAAFTEQPGRVPSDLPFAYAAEPQQLAVQLGASGRFTLYVVAKDGSVVEQTNRVQNGQRVLDLLVNSRPQQLAEPR